MGGLVNIPYRHPVVRDLAWVMLAPGLLKSAPAGQRLVTDEWCMQTYTAHTSYLRELDENPAPLLDALSQCKSHRLGIYFEWLLRYWLEKILQVQQLHHNVPIFQVQKNGGRHTLGEFDFLFRVGENKPLQHWEITVKFYLQKINADGNICWVGPGDRDRLDIKLARLFQHQLKLANLSEAQECLNHMGGGSLQPAAFVKGYLFYPLNADGVFSSSLTGDANLAPFTLSSNHHKGWWLHWRKMPMPVVPADSRWLVLPKRRWLSPVRQQQTDASLLDEKALATCCDAHFHQHRQPLLVVELKWEIDAWQEVSRGFVLAPE